MIEGDKFSCYMTFQKQKFSAQICASSSEICVKCFAQKMHLPSAQNTILFEKNFLTTALKICVIAQYRLTLWTLRTGIAAFVFPYIDNYLQFVYSSVHRLNFKSRITDEEGVKICTITFSFYVQKCGIAWKMRLKTYTYRNCTEAKILLSWKP